MYKSLLLLYKVINIVSKVINMSIFSICVLVLFMSFSVRISILLFNVFYVIMHIKKSNLSMKESDIIIAKLSGSIHISSKGSFKEVIPLLVKFGVLEVMPDYPYGSNGVRRFKTCMDICIGDLSMLHKGFEFLAHA